MKLYRNMNFVGYEYENWKYIPGLFPQSEKDYFSEIYEGIKDKVAVYYHTIYGKTYEVKKVSCIFTSKEYTENFGNKADAKSNLFGYDQTPSFAWETAPQTLLDVKNQIQELFDFKSDYVLVHIYRDRHDNIGYHNDKEALDSPVCSISFGCTRIFELKEIGRKGNECDYQYHLYSGDVFYMKKGCQKKYVHRIPPMKLIDIKDILGENDIDTNKIKKNFDEYEKVAENNGIDFRRINLTFRQF